MKPIVSIIIPCYNRVGLLKQTLLSVKLAIKNLEAEIILVDDGSEIPIKDQLEEFKELPIKFIRQINSGLTISRYNGLMHACGEFIQFLDSDDLIAQEKLSLQISEMQKNSADVSYSDALQIRKHAPPQISNSEEITIFRNTQNPAEFYIDVQPAPHSPIFRRDYLRNILINPFIPLSRDFDSIGEIWFYYNLCPFPANIIKISKPLTICIHHNEERLTNHWERLGLCALKLQLMFVNTHPKHAKYAEDATKYVGKAAFNSYRGLPYNIYKPFQNAFIQIWKDLGSTTHLGGGKYFNFMSKFIGAENSAKFFRRISNNKYELIRTITEKELIDKTLSIIKPE